MKKLLLILCICANSPIFSMLKFLRRSSVNTHPSINMHQRTAEYAVETLRDELSKETNHISNNEIIRAVRQLQKVDFSKIDKKTTITVAATLKIVNVYAKNNPIMALTLTPIITATLIGIVEIVPVTILSALGFWPEGGLYLAAITNTFCTSMITAGTISAYSERNRLQKALRTIDINN